MDLDSFATLLLRMEDATRAVNEMNGKLIAGKPIFVALAQRRHVRRAQLEAHQHNQGRGGRGNGFTPLARSSCPIPPSKVLNSEKKSSVII